MEIKTVTRKRARALAAPVLNASFSMTLAQKDAVNEYFVKTEGWWRCSRNTVGQIDAQKIAGWETELNTVVAKINELVQRKNTLLAQIARAKEPVAQPHEPETDEHRKKRFLLVNEERNVPHTKVVTVVYRKKKNSSNEASDNGKKT